MRIIYLITATVALCSGFTAGMFFLDHPSVITGSIALTGAVVFILIWYLAHKRTERIKEQKERKDAQATQYWVDKILHREGQLKLPRALLFAVLLPCAVWLGYFLTVIHPEPHKDALLFKAGGYFLMFICGFSFLHFLPGFGKPALIIDKSGVTFPLYGKVPWKNIIEVSLMENTSSKGVTTYSLMFRFENFADAIERYHWTDTLLAIFCLGPLRLNRMGVRIPSLRVSPHMLEAVTKELKEKLNPMWYPEGPKEYVDAWKRLHDNNKLENALHRRNLEMLSHLTDDDLPDKIKKVEEINEQTSQLWQQQIADREIVDIYMKRKANKDFYSMLVLVGFLALLLIVAISAKLEFGR